MPAEESGTQKSNPSLRKEVGKNIKTKKETKEGGMEFHPGKGVLKREKFPKPGNLLTDQSVPSFGSTEGNITGRKNK